MGIRAGHRRRFTAAIVKPSSPNGQAMVTDATTIEPEKEAAKVRPLGIHPVMKITISY
jgi:hypothetical protein